MSMITSAGTGFPLSIGSSTAIIGLAEWTDGTYNVMDEIIPPGLIVAPHVHDNEAQSSFVVSGRLGFWVDGEEFELGASDYILRPAGKPHSLWNSTSEPARMLEITSPAASFERYMRALSELADSGNAELSQVVALAESYGVRFVDGLEALSARHGVSAAGGFWK
jgi:mannose-6-phosphate isomerase-like protein (cupin superfamily)